MVLNWIIKRCTLTFTFDFKTLFKLIPNPLPKSSVYIGQVESIHALRKIFFVVRYDFDLHTLL